VGEVDGILSFIDSLDKAAVDWLQANFQLPVLTEAMRIVTDKVYWYLPLAALLIFFIIKGGRLRAAAVLFLPLLLLSDSGTVRLLKPLFGRPRPLGHGGLSMPSVHAANAYAIATLFSYFVRKWSFSIFAFVMAALVAYSRVHLGLHYPSDVIAGAAVGTADAMIIIVIYLVSREWLEKRAAWLFPQEESGSTKD
jgi:undecaprenyl-diphosphatase